MRMCAARLPAASCCFESGEVGDTVSLAGRLAAFIAGGPPGRVVLTSAVQGHTNGCRPTAKNEGKTGVYYNYSVKPRNHSSQDQLMSWIIPLGLDLYPALNRGCSTLLLTNLSDRWLKTNRGDYLKPGIHSPISILHRV